MQYNVVHIAYTPLAGAPYRIVKALNLYSNYKANLITLDPYAYGNRVFPGDLRWNDHREICVNMIKRADIVHIHQYVDLRAALGIDLAEECNKKICIRQWHSEPEHFFKEKEMQQKMLNESITQLVIAQYHSRYYASAIMVPNLVGIDKYKYKLARSRDVPHVAWSPSLKVSAWEARWSTKGYNEIKKILDYFRKKGYCTYEIIYNIPYEECLQKKKNADLVIDDLVTGSYHLSGLEGLALGKPVLGFLDEPVERNLRKITGATRLPWINVHLENVEGVLEYLLCRMDLLELLGYYSYQWMNTYYLDEKLIHYYTRVYDNLIHNISACEIKESNEITKKIDDFYNRVMPDLLWHSRKDRMDIRFYSTIKKLQHIFRR